MKKDVSARLAVAKLLKRKGYSVEDISSGSGVPKWSRLEISNDTETLSCAVKVMSKGSGRIHFVREGKNTYKVLSDVDLILLSDPISETSFKISAFNQKTILKAFERTFEALEREGKTKYEIWLSPNHEAGTRFLGSGFQKDALWSETFSFDDAREPTHSPSSRITLQVGTKLSTVVEVLNFSRDRIAELTGLPAEAIHLELKMKA